jgi:hypothetical protein
MHIDKLELNTETLRQLTEDELTNVAGGQQVTIPPLTGNETYYCPTIGRGFPYCQGATGN